MANWRDRLRPASFKGIPFYIEGHSLEGGQRNVPHEFPKRNTPFIENMGRKAESFSMDAYVLGDDYFDARDALLNALRDGGTGELIHPYLGTIKVMCGDSWSMKETTDEGRIARFTLAFLETGETIYPNQSNDVVSRAFVAADAAKEFAIEDFAGTFSVDAIQDFAKTTAIEQLQKVGIDLKDIAGTINSEIVGQLGFIDTINQYIGDVAGLVATPGELAKQIFGMVEGITGIIESPYKAILKIIGLFDYGSNDGSYGASTATRIRQEANRIAVNSLVQRAAVIESTRSAASADYETSEDAIAVRNTIADKLDDIMEDVLTTDEFFTAAQNLRTQVVRSVPPEGTTLPNLLTIVPIITQPALTLAYDLYEDAGREAEIVTRNSLKYPGFVPGAQGLQIVSAV